MRMIGGATAPPIVINFYNTKVQSTDDAEKHAFAIARRLSVSLRGAVN
jgi:hypothetical protein